MSILTVDQFRLHMPDVAVEDDALRVLLDANEKAIIRRVGDTGTQTETFELARPVSYPGSWLPGFPAPVAGGGYLGNGWTVLRLKAEPAAIIAFTQNGDSVPEDDYVLEDHYIRARNGRVFLGKIEVIYTPDPDYANRIVVLVDLMKLDLDHQPGFTAQSTGGWQESYTSDHLAKREEILDRLIPRDLFA